MSPQILLLHGPNLNLLGMREPQHYGHDTLADINARLAKQAKAVGYRFDALQSNAEATLIERVHATHSDGTAFVLINPAAFTHTSVGLRDALAAIGLPFIEIHLSNVYKREPFRHHSYFSDLAIGVISGLGTHGYELAMTHAIRLLNDNA